MVPRIQIESLSKAYRIGMADKHDGFRDTFARIVKSPMKEMRRFSEDYTQGDDVFWAPKDISFEVAEGETVGIIGRNGAGKSTLLKVLSRITEPTTGRARMRGRVSSLLEVGTGFHPELSGRENIYLNGAILGMPRREITAKFDDIVEFSEVGRFLDTPVKRYSSGMYVRLAFAVAAHLDPQIMIVDEVLAVGDAAFQEKCLGKMDEVAKGEGRTILFVSHSMDAIASLCSSVVLVQHGQTPGKVPTEEGIADYLGNGNEGGVTLSQLPRDQHKRRPPIFHDLKITSNGEDTVVVPAGGQVSFDVLLKNFDDAGSYTVAVALRNRRGQRAVLFHSLYQCGLMFKPTGEHRFTCDVPALPLCPGQYDVELVLASGFGEEIERVERAAAVEVVFADLFGTGKLPMDLQSTIALPCRWNEVETTAGV